MIAARRRQLRWFAKHKIFYSWSGIKDSPFSLIPFAYAFYSGDAQRQMHCTRAPNVFFKDKPE